MTWYVLKFLSDIQDLDRQFQSIHEQASKHALNLEDSDLVEKDNILRIRNA